MATAELTASTLRTFSWAAAALVAAALAGAGCDKPGADPYRAALSKYQALVAAGRAPVDPAFDEVLRELDRVPAGDREHAQAEKLKASLLRARSPAALRPLVTPFGASGDEPDVAAKRAECEALAQKLGPAAVDQRDALRAKLTTCRAQQQEIEELRHSKEHAR